MADWTADSADSAETADFFSTQNAELRMRNGGKSGGDQDNGGRIMAVRGV